MTLIKYSNCGVFLRTSTIRLVESGRRDVRVIVIWTLLSRTVRRECGQQKCLVTDSSSSPRMTHVCRTELPTSLLSGRCFPKGTDYSLEKNWLNTNLVIRQELCKWLWYTYKNWTKMQCHEQCSEDFLKGSVRTWDYKHYLLLCAHGHNETALFERGCCVT